MQLENQYAPFEITGLEPDSTEASSVVVKLLLGFWATEFAMSISLWVILGVNPLNYIPIKAAVSLVSLLLTFVTTRIIRSFRVSNIISKIFLSFPLSILAAMISTSFEFGLFHYIDPAVAVQYDLGNFCYSLFYAISLFFGWSCFFIAHLYHLEARAHERRFAISREEALNAKVQVLHYQINPHFLFNTLNSVVGLIEEGASTHASRMVISLSSFMRKMLELDPLHDLTLAEELSLETEYLRIEQERFSDRMSVSFQIPEELADALVPSLILQPLIENAVKHGLACSSGFLTVTITAVQEGEALILFVDNVTQAPMRFHAAGRPSLGIGLANVEHRIRARFPQAGSLIAGPVSPMHFRAMLTMPLRRADSARPSAELSLGVHRAVNA
nr:histidine kinase [uncultured Shinella sp.]